MDGEAPVRFTEPALWREPVRGTVTPRDHGDLDGLAQMQGIRARPPMSRLTGVTFESVSRGTATFSMPATRWLCWSRGVVPGGVLALLADGALGCAVQSELPAHTAYTTAELSLAYVRPVPVGAQLVAVGRALHAGRRVGLATAEVRDDAGRLIAFTETRCAVFAAGGEAPLRGGTAPHPPQAGDPRTAGDEADPYQRAAPVLAEADAGDDRDGLAALRAQIGGEVQLPPLHHLTGIAPTAAGDGVATCVLPLSGWTATPYGWPQGGFVAMLADLALALAVQTTVPAGGRFASVDLKVNFLRPLACDGSLLTARAEVVHRGRSLAIATCEVTAADGRRAALATGSCALQPPSE